MGLKIKLRDNKKYYYVNLSYRIINRSLSFAKYIGLNKPFTSELKTLEDKFKDEIIYKLSNQKYTAQMLTKDDTIKSLLFRDAFYKKYNSWTPTKRKKYEVDSTILFTLTTLTTENVDVELQDVKTAFDKSKNLTLQEQISKNMIKAVELIKTKQELTKDYILGLHALTMNTFETKTPGKIRNKQVIIQKIDEKNPLGIEINYKPPKAEQINKLLNDFILEYKNSKLNPIEKSALTHYKLYLIHPFLDGNKRICRLVFNKILLENGFPLINISDKKENYFKNLLRSVEENNTTYFVNFAKDQYFKQITIFLKSK